MLGLQALQIHRIACVPCLSTDGRGPEESFPDLREEVSLKSENTSNEKAARDRSASGQHIHTVAKGSATLFSGRLFRHLFRFVIACVLARLLAPEHFGLYNLALTGGEIVAALASIGLGTALVRFIPVCLAHGDRAGIWGALQVALGLTVASSLLLGFALYALADPISKRLFHEPQMVPLLKLVSVFVPFLVMNSTVAAATRGFKKMHYTVVAQSISQPLVRLIIVGLLAIGGLTVAGALTAYGLAEAVGAGLLFYFLSKQFPLKLPLREGKRNAKEMLRFSVPVYLSKLVNTFGLHLQTLLLGAFGSAQSIGVFALARQIGRLGQIFHNPIVTASQPVISEIFSTQRKGELSDFYQTTARWTFTLNLPIFLVLILVPSELLSLFGRGYAAGATVVVILAWRHLIHTSTGMCGEMLSMTGHTKLKLFNSIARLALAVVLGLLLIPRWGVVGAATAALVADGAVDILALLEVFLLLRVAPYNFDFLKPIAAGVITLAGILTVTHWFASERTTSLALIQVIALLCIYLSVTMLLGLSAYERGVLGHLQRRAKLLLGRS